MANDPVRTAEIPAVPAGPSYGVLLPDGSVWYPGSKKRLPAPTILRVVVWILAFLVLLAGLGDFVVHYHPSWVAPLRHVVNPNEPAGSGPTTTTSSTDATSTSSTLPANTGVSITNPQPTTLAARTTQYTVDQSTYTIVVKAGTQAVWVDAQPYVNNYPSGQGQDETLQPGQSMTVNAKGVINLEIAATGATTSIYFGSKLAGTIPSPPSIPWHFYLVPGS